MILSTTNSFELEVILPFHRVDSYLLQSIDSVLKSRNVNLRLIVINDSDLKVSKHDIGLRSYDLLIENKNHSYTNALKVGVENSSSKFVAFQDSDDLTDPDRLHIQIELLRSTNSSYCSGKLTKLNNNGRILNINNLTGPIPDSRDPRDLWVIGSHRADSTIMVEGELLRRTWKLHSSFPGMFADYAWALSLPNETKFIHSKQAIYYYRSHERQISRVKNLEENWEEVYPHWLKNLEKSSLSVPESSQLTPNIGLATSFPSTLPKLNRSEKQIMTKMISSIKRKLREKKVPEYSGWIVALNRRGLLATRFKNPIFWPAIPRLLSDLFLYLLNGIKPR